MHTLKYPSTVIMERPVYTASTVSPFTRSDKSAGMALPADTNQWGHNIIAEVSNRIPKITPFIQEYRTVYADENGKGLGMLILQGGKAFIPVVIDEWKIKPIDVVLFKKGKQLKFAYLSERTLIALLTTSSLGNPVRSGGVGADDVGINLMTPAGGYGGRISNPFYGRKSAAEVKVVLDDLATDVMTKHPGCNIFTNSLSKSAFAAEILRTEHNYHKKSEELSELARPVVNNTPNQINMLTKLADGSYHWYTDIYPEGVAVTPKQASRLLATISNPSVRHQKAASLTAEGMVMLSGPQLPRRGNVLLQHTPVEDWDSKKYTTPTVEGMYMVGKAIPTYINPNITYLDGSPCSYNLVVQLGAYSLTKDIEESIAPVSPDGAMQSREELLPTLRPNKIKPGMIVTFYNEKTRKTSIPAQIESVMYDEYNRQSLRVTPMLNALEQITITFYEGNVIHDTQDGYNTILYPFETKIRELPRSAKRVETYNRNSEYNVIEVAKGGGHLYQIKENNDLLPKMFTYGDVAFKLVRRYGFSDNQAIQFLNKLNMEKRKNFLVNVFLDEADDTPKPDFNTVPEREKEAIRSVLKIASSLDKARTIHKSADQVHDKFMDLLTHLTSKYAADEQPQQGPGNSGQPQQNSPNPGQGVPSGMSIMEYLMNVRPVPKDTQDVIDQLTFYALGRFRTEEGIELVNQLEETLMEVENHLAKLMLLTLFHRIPGHDYQDAKVLLSDIDSFISTIRSSRVLLRI